MGSAPAQGTPPTSTSELPPHRRPSHHHRRQKHIPYPPTTISSGADQGGSRHRNRPTIKWRHHQKYFSDGAEIECEFRGKIIDRTNIWRVQRVPRAQFKGWKLVGGEVGFPSEILRPFSSPPPF